MKLVLLVVVLVVAGVLLYSYSGLFTRSNPAVPQAALAPAPTAASGEVRLEVTEDALTRQLGALGVGQPIGASPLGTAVLRSVKVQMLPGKMVTTGQADVGSNGVSFDATSKVQAVAGKPVVTVQDAHVASIPMPDQAKQQVQALVQSQVDEAVSQSSARVTSVTIEQGKMVIIGTASR